ncbi:MAG: hypothetical protein KDD62_01070 [Bdellovibrionales bacterium]|nr:hypothetical protein [Bdellovibrionales bacterium]
MHDPHVYRYINYELCQEWIKRISDQHEQKHVGRGYRRIVCGLAPLISWLGICLIHWGKQLEQFAQPKSESTRTSSFGKSL